MDERVERMSQTSDDRLQFSINESVWLKDDAPAEEILSMALEPDITVEENRNDVTIRGYLRLSGEYRPAAHSELSDQFQPAPFRRIDEIIETNEGTAVLEHHFPIDITIPRDRVPDLENLYVTIESFDYELAGQRHIQLQADIAITGLDNATAERKEKPAVKPFKKAAPVEQPKPVKAEKAAPVEQPKPAKAEKAAPAEQPKPVKAEKAAPAKKTEKPKVKAENPSPKQSAGLQAGKTQAAKKDKGTVAEKAQLSPTAETTQPAGAPEKKAVKKAAWKAFKGKRADDTGEDGADGFNGEFYEMPTDRQFDDDDEEPAEFQYEAFRKPEAPEAGGTAPLIAFSERTEQPAVSAPPEPAPEQAVEGTEKEAGSQYLTKVLSGEESEQRTAVKICIVQSGDSLESISERYHVPVTSLLRKNALVSANIDAGEILYIPQTKKGSRDE
jgi:FOG: LysM repeat